MAVLTIKSTYSLDIPTVRKLERLALLWRVPKSEVIRRAISQAAETLQEEAENKIQELIALQKRLKKKGTDFDAWKKQIQDARR